LAEGSSQRDDIQVRRVRFSMRRVWNGVSSEAEVEYRLVEEEETE